MKTVSVAPRLQALLADGEVRSHDALVRAMSAWIPPENATWEYRRRMRKLATYKASRQHTYRPRPLPSLSRQVHMGRAALITNCLSRLCQRGVVECLGGRRGSLSWRAVTATTTADAAPADVHDGA